VQFISCSSPQSSSQEQVIEEQEVGEKVKTILFFGNSLTAGYGIDPDLSRLDWFLEEEPYIFILELGGNDGLRGIALAETKKNLLSIIDKVHVKYPNTKIVLAGMQIPPNMGQEYTNGFKAIYPEIAKEKNVTLIPFLLEGVAGDPELNLPDGIHPTEEGHRIVFETLWPYLEKLL